MRLPGVMRAKRVAAKLAGRSARFAARASGTRSPRVLRVRLRPSGYLLARGDSMVDTKQGPTGPKTRYTGLARVVHGSLTAHGKSRGGPGPCFELLVSRLDPTELSAMNVMHVGREIDRAPHPNAPFGANGRRIMS